MLPMILRSDPQYPLHRMYVVKLDRDAMPDALHGRLENLVSGTQRHFASAQELHGLMERDLEREDAPGQSPDPIP